MTEQCLIIGGPHDGQWVEYSGKTISRAVYPPIEAWPRVLPEVTTYSRAEYHALDWHCGSSEKQDEIVIYVVKGMTARQALERLLRHYRPAEKDAGVEVEEQVSAQRRNPNRPSPT